MAFRDETEALRARIEALEGDLARAEQRAEEADEARRELIVLRARVKDLEGQLGLAKRPAWARPWLWVGACALVGVVAGGLMFGGGGGLDPDAAAARGPVSLDAEPRPLPITSTTVGEHAADELATGCDGFLPDRPALSLRTDRTVNVRLWTRSRADLVMVVQSAGGELVCDDDSGHDYNPLVLTQLGPGEHRVWVGTYEEDVRAGFELHVEANVDLDEHGLEHDPEPALATLRPDAALFGRSLAGSTHGEVPASRARPGCGGHVPLQPHVRLELAEPREVRITAHSPTDLVLLLERPDGSFLCDDDSGEEYDPALTATLEAGAHRLWVGTYQVADDAHFDLTVDAARAALTRSDDALPARLGRWDLTEEPLLSFSGLVAAVTPVTTTQPSCRDGWGLGGRDLELVLAEPRTVSLDLDGPGETRLLLEHPDGTQTCTGPEGLGARHFAAGVHRVWLVVPEGSRRHAFDLVAHVHPP